MREVISIVAAFFLGSIPFGYILYRWHTGEDIRKKGSGNIGATNVARVAGLRLGLLVAVLDIAKAASGVALAGYLTDSPTIMAAAAFAAIAGHSFTPFLGWKGGKGVACLVGSFLLLTPLSLGAGLIVFILVIALTRMVSAGSMIMSLSLPILTLLIYSSPTFAIAQIAAAAVIILRHRDNIKRIMEGRENKLRFK